MRKSERNSNFELGGNTIQKKKTFVKLEKFDWGKYP